MRSGRLFTYQKEMNRKAKKVEEVFSFPASLILLFRLYDKFWRVVRTHGPSPHVFIYESARSAANRYSASPCKA
jgi:hypothetical protein